MRRATINSYCDQLCDQLVSATDPLTANLTKVIVESLHEIVYARELNKDDYTWLFMRAAALGHQFASRLQGGNQDALDDEALQIIQSKLVELH